MLNALPIVCLWLKEMLRREKELFEFAKNNENNNFLLLWNRLVIYTFAGCLFKQSFSRLSLSEKIRSLILEHWTIVKINHQN